MGFWCWELPTYHGHWIQPLEGGLLMLFNIRFEKRVYIPLPDMNGILSLLTNRLKDTPSNITPAELEQLS